MKTTKATRLSALYSTLQSLGFTLDEADALRRAEITLHRWSERECNGEIERDEKTGKVFYYSNSRNERTSYTVPDRETGALKRIASTLAARNLRHGDDLSFYHQTDPRGCALYIIRPGDTPAGGKVESYYSRGVAVCL